MSKTLQLVCENVNTLLLSFTHFTGFASPSKLIMYVWKSPVSPLRTSPPTKHTTACIQNLTGPHGDRAFRPAGSRLWNDLLNTLKAPEPTERFRKRTKDISIVKHANLLKDF